jgi:cytoskeletal protein RodZ
MKSVGETLFSARERKKFTIENIVELTHINPEYVKAIEANAFHTIPSDVAARGFVSLYAQVVGLDPKTILALYRRDVKIHDRKEPMPVRSALFAWNSRRHRRLLGYSVLLGGILALLIYSIVVGYSLSQAPRLTIKSPRSESHVNSPVTVRGVTLTDAVVSVDGAAIGVNQDGEFVEQLELSPGPHIITIKATGRNGRENIEQISFIVDDQ